MERKSVGLAAVMERNRLQQKHVAEALGVSRMAVLAWYHGRSIPSGDNLVRLLAYFRSFEPGLQAEDLLPAPEPPAPAPAPEEAA